MHPELAASKSGVSNDPVADVQMSEPWLKMIWGDPFAPKDEVGLTSPEPAAPFAPQGEQAQPQGEQSTPAKDNIKGSVNTYTQMRNGRKVQISGYVRSVKGGQQAEEK